MTLADTKLSVRGDSPNSDLTTKPRIL